MRNSLVLVGVQFCISLILQENFVIADGDEGLDMSKRSEKLWRDDGRCGPSYPLPNGKPGQCDPTANANEKGPCCSSSGWCGNSDAHCKCSSCISYAGCPKGWKTFGGDCYLLIPQTVATYASAEKRCEENGAVLVSSENERKNEFLEDMLDEARDGGILPNGVDIWLSARRPNTSAPFAWKTGAAVGYSDWYEGQPRDNHGGIALCMQTFKNSGKFWSWHVANCDGGDADQAVVCEKISGFSISGGPSPNEGNVFYNGAPICDDVWDNTDARVFCKMFGYQYGTATHRSSYGQVSSHFSMDNVQCNGNEVSLLDCPRLTQDNCGSHEGAGVICSGCPQGWKTFGGDCYLLIPQTVATYASAEKRCEENGAVLVSPETEGKNEFLEDMLDEARDGGILPNGVDIWLSARRPNTSAPFAWKTGASLGYSDWYEGQPRDNHFGIALCMQTFKNSGKFWSWHVANCDGGDADQAVVCEKISGYLSLGCWKDTSNRAIATLEGTDTRLTGNYRERKNAVELCFEVAKSKGYPAFAVQNGGWCAASSTVLETYKKYGAASNCADGKGGAWANDVYKIQDQCYGTIEEKGWYAGSHVVQEFKQDNAAQCGKTCCDNEDCEIWVWRSHDNMCHLKKNDGPSWHSATGHWSAKRKKG